LRRAVMVNEREMQEMKEHHETNLEIINQLSS